MIEDYLALKERLKKRNSEERGQFIDRKRHLEETFEPVVVSNQRMAQDIIKDLVPITEGLQRMNRTIGMKEPWYVEDVDEDASPSKRLKAMTPTLTPRQKTMKLGITAAKYFEHALNNNSNDNIFGFRFKDENSQNINNLMIGDKTVHFLPDDDLQIGNRRYHGTPGLYELITYKNPYEYTQEDLANYTEIVKQTHVLYRENNPSNEHRWNRSDKWKYILKPIWMEVLEEPVQPTRLFDEADGDGLYLHKSGHCVKVEPIKGNGLYLTPHRRLGRGGDGLYLKRGSTIQDGSGLLLGPNSPFKNIPILNLLL
ncbi:MAG: hypothetical protein MK215_05870 [Candidatus Poseidoniia archaeon]|nr:hypothetical protein [Candidatus Poseidoniia archaeon]